MKKIFTCLFIIIVGILFSNLIEAEYFSEFFFEGEDWTIELSNSENGYPIYFNNYDLKIATSYSEAYINRNMFLIYGNTELITQNDLDSILIIDHTGDFIRLIDEYNYILDEKIFGNYSGSYVNSLYPGQSYVCDINVGFAPVKENFPSLGSDPFYTDARGTYSGYVLNSNMQPLVNAEIRYYLHTPAYYSQIVTNNEGYFEDDDIYCRNYYVQVYYNGILEASSTITIEPDSTSYEEFVLPNVSIKDELLKSRNYSLSNYPNPFNPNTEISFETTNLSEESRIEIFNSRGQKLKVLPVILSPESSFGKGSATWDGTNETGKHVPSGVYLYKLVSNGKELAVNKMLLLK